MVADIGTKASLQSSAYQSGSSGQKHPVSSFKFQVSPHISLALSAKKSKTSIMYREVTNT
jgi:hypothetical protein